jgi:hypothetical protein
MARNKRDCDRSTFRPEDAIDELFGGASPNPQRIGCPGQESLRAAARKALPMEHATYDHLAECSECYREFRQCQQRRAGQRWYRFGVAAAAVLVVAVVGGVYAGRDYGFGSGNIKSQAMVLDYRNEGATRSEAGDPARLPKTLPRTSVAATILPPIGSEPGEYEVRLVDGGGHVKLSRAVAGEMQNFAVQFNVNFDLRSFARGPYSLEIRRIGEDWDPHPVMIR